MTENEKEFKCKDCEYCKSFVEGVKEFTFKALIIYVGVTLAIITSANILKPKHHYPMPGPYPRYESTIPRPMMNGGYRHHPFMAPNGGFHKPGHFNGPDGGFKGQKLPFNEKPQLPPKK